MADVADASAAASAAAQPAANPSRPLLPYTPDRAAEQEQQWANVIAFANSEEYKSTHEDFPYEAFTADADPAYKTFLCLKASTLFDATRAVKFSKIPEDDL